MNRRSVIARGESISLRRALLCEAIGLGGAGLSLLLAVALVTQRPEESGPSGPAGALGAAVARPMLLWLGVSALVLVATTFGLSTSLFLRRRVREPGLKALGLFLLLLGSASLATLAFPAAPVGFLERSGPGGILGAFLADVLQRAAGPVGAAVVTVLALMVGLAFTTGRLYLELLQAFLHWIPERLRRAREVSEERRQRKVETAEEKKAAKERLAAEKKKEARRRDLIQERLREQAPTPPEPEPERPAPTPGPKPEPKPKPKPRKAKKPAARAAKPGGAYQFPPVDLLDRPARTDLKKEEGAIQENARTLEATLREFKIEAEVVDFQRGPVVTMYELDIAKGVKVKKLVSYADDIAMALAAQSVRVVAPIPGKSTAGVEVPNRTRDAVRLRALLDHPDYKAKKKQAVPMLLGMDVTGSAIVPDLESMPHLLIAGSTGSGKSVCINAIILSVLYTRTPEEVRLILVDPKQVELSFFADVPHLLTPVVTDMRRAPAILEWAVEKMEERYRLLALTKVRNIASYNRIGKTRLAELREEHEVDEEEVPDQLCRIVIVIDELADLMFMAQKEIEGFITRLAQKSRAVGIHVILATQRPQAQVVTGLIKANMPTRIAFKVISSLDSRVIMDRVGAERLLGAGDMLFLPPRSSALVRAQGTLVSDDEVRRVVDWLKERHPPSFSEELEEVSEGGGLSAEEKDPLYDEAVRVILESQRGSASLLQRALAVGYTRASRLMDQMARDGVVGQFKGSKAREVLLTLEDWEQRQG
jgi:S-DNA-T family DNA segregation ATPase FtsK/SpoIIIE